MGNEASKSEWGRLYKNESKYLSLKQTSSWKFFIPWMSRNWASISKFITVLSNFFLYLLKKDHVSHIALPNGNNVFSSNLMQKRILRPKKKRYTCMFGGWKFMKCQYDAQKKNPKKHKNKLVVLGKCVKITSTSCMCLSMFYFCHFCLFLMQPFIFPFNAGLFQNFTAYEFL